MAQAGNAQREPTMEEILASIRRIIEDGEEDGQPGAPPAAESGHAASGESDGEIVEVEAFRAELNHDARKQPAPERDSRPASLAELQTAIRRESQDVRADADTREDNDAAAETQAVGPEPATDEASPAVPAGQTAEAGTQEPGNRTPAATGATESEPPGYGGLDPLTDRQGKDAVASASAPRSGIISERAEKQVAAAFGELSDALAASRRQSFDEMAENMLRPMLQEWLDNNLPGLVERLVREEIERVARGDAS